VGPRWEHQQIYEIRIVMLRLDLGQLCSSFWQVLDLLLSEEFLLKLLLLFENPSNYWAHLGIALFTLKPLESFLYEILQTPLKLY